MNVLSLVVFAQVFISDGVIRFNQLGYLPDAPKAAVYCGPRVIDPPLFRVTDATGRTVLRDPSKPPQQGTSSSRQWPLALSIRSNQAAA